MKKPVSRGIRTAWLLLSVFCLCCMFFLTGGIGIPIRHIEAAAEKEPYEIEVEVGYDGEYAIYRRTPIRVTASSWEEDFVGTLEVLYPADNNNVINYRQELVLAAGETKEVCFYIKLPMYQSEMTVRLVDREERVKKAMVEKLQPNVDGGMVVGILSGADIASFFSSADSVSTMLLSTEDIMEADNMGMLDMILVEHFDLGSLQAAQVQALEQWVKEGGTLVLGTGSYYNETLSAFSDDFLSGRIGDLTEISYYYREDAKEQLTYCPLSLEGAQEVLTVSEQPLIWRVDRGEGNVLLSAISLELPSWLQLSLGEEISSALCKQVSENRQNRMLEEQHSGYIWYLENALNQGNTANMPKIPVYAVVLTIYVLLVGPILYLILKKIDKRHYMWGAVPLTSVVFAGVIFLIGMPTRISEPYMNYVTYLTYEKTEPGDTTDETGPKEKTWFRLTAPYNKTYDVIINKDYEISQTLTNWYSNYDTGAVLTDYDIGITANGTETDIELRKPAAFESFDFSAKGKAQYGLSQDNGGASGDYEAQLTWNDGGNITGTFTNRLGYKLEKVFLVCPWAVYFVSDAVEDGESISIDTSGVPSAFASNNYGSINNNGILEQVFEPGYYQIPEENRKYNAIGYYLNNNVYQGSMTRFVGIAEGCTEVTLTTDCEMESYGVTISILQVEDEGLEKSNFYYSIDEYLDTVLEGDCGLPQDRYMYADVTICEYDLQEELGIPSSIWYSLVYNNELKGMTYEYFPGLVYFLNQETGEYDLIFTGGIEGSCEDLSPYLSDGHLVIRYEVETEQFYNERYNIVFPILSFSREEVSSFKEEQEGDKNGTD